MSELLDERELLELLQGLLALDGRLEPFAFHLVDVRLVDGSGHPPSRRAAAAAVRDLAFDLCRLLPSGDSVAFLGRGQLAVVQKSVDSDGYKYAEAICQKLAQIAKPKWHNVICNVGSVNLAETAGSPFLLVRVAEQALAESIQERRAKHNCDGAFAFAYGMDDGLTGDDLLSALAAGQFEFFYQPIVSAKTLEIVQYEALIRWKHPTRCYVQPAHFIPAAERSGAIVEIGKWGLSEACKRIKANADGVGVAVNISAIGFGASDMSLTIEHALVESGLAPDLLTIEITETALLAHSDRVRWQLDRIHDIGVKISIDDFGTGYSSLAYIHSMPVHSIKIDRMFVNSMATSPRSQSVLDGVLRIAADLGLDTVAEGIETEVEADLIREKGIDRIQGYYFGAPMPPAIAFGDCQLEFDGVQKIAT